jgi:hypothetical protein
MDQDHKGQREAEAQYLREARWELRIEWAQKLYGRAYEDLDPNERKRVDEQVSFDMLRGW